MSSFQKPNSVQQINNLESLSRVQKNIINDLTSPNDNSDTNNSNNSTNNRMFPLPNFQPFNGLPFPYFHQNQLLGYQQQLESNSEAVNPIQNQINLSGMNSAGFPQQSEIEGQNGNLLNILQNNRFPPLMNLPPLFGQQLLPNYQILAHLQNQQLQQQLSQLRDISSSLKNNNQPPSQLLTHLSSINNPLLIQQLYNTVTNPIENARLSSILERLTQNSLALNNNFPISNNQAPHQQQSVFTTSAREQKLIQQQKQKEELTSMLQYLVDKMHQCDTDQIFEKKREFKFMSGDDLNIFDNIVQKYQFSKKTKEEMIKYILRKCFKFLKSGIKQQEIVGQKGIEVAFTKKYFGGEIESSASLEIQKQFISSSVGFQKGSKDSDDSEEEPQVQSYKVKEENIDQPQETLSSSKIPLLPSTGCLEQKDIVEKVMPFKEGSKIKTMNIQFLKMIFRSKIFTKDYQSYLDKFEELAEKENQKKIQKCVKNLQDFIDKGQINKVKSYKRLPWLKIWLKDTFELAKTLVAYADDDGQKESEVPSSELKKKIKTQELFSIQSSTKVNGEESTQNDMLPPSQSDLSHQKIQSTQILEETVNEGEWKQPQQIRRSPKRVLNDVSGYDSGNKTVVIPKAKKSAELLPSEVGDNSSKIIQ